MREAQLNTTDHCPLSLNGKDYAEFAGGTIADLTRQLQLPPRQFAVEVNQQLIPREQHSEHQLAAGDRVEIVTLVGGG
jgi:sulfur carrier protein